MAMKQQLNKIIMRLQDMSITKLIKEKEYHKQKHDDLASRRVIRDAELETIQINLQEIKDDINVISRKKKLIALREEVEQLKHENLLINEHKCKLEKEIIMLKD